MLVNIKKQTEETIELQLPAYFKNGYGTISNITENEMIIVTGNSVSVVFKNDVGEDYYNGRIEQAISGDQSNDAEFINLFNAAMSVINPLINNAVIV